jgi:hypothetical protein
MYKLAPELGQRLISQWECLRCGQYFVVMLPDAIIGGPFLPPHISSPQ